MDFNPIRFGKYLLLERINIGGMAEVFRAKTFGVEGFERIVAIKRILPNLVEDDEFVTMFIDEARIAVQLNHPNIAQIYELGKHGDHYYIAMEFLASRDLRLMLDRFKENGRIMPISQAAYIATKLCEALDYAHRKKDPGGTPMNIIHRDVSPQNILISFDGEVKMIDFGIAKAANRASKTQVGVLKGKFAYMSPEQVRGLPIDRRSDVFAVGIVLYEMLTGERLFIAESDFSTLQRVRDAVVGTPTQFNQNIPPELEMIVLKALAREVDDRYQWASELAEALQPFLIQGRTIYGPKNMAETIRTDYAEEVAAERAKTEHFREVGSSGEQFAGANEETEPQDHETYGAPESRTDEGQSQDNDFDDDEEGETIIFEASEARALLEREGKKQAAQKPSKDSGVTAESEPEGFEGDDDSDATIVQMTSPFWVKPGDKEGSGGSSATEHSGEPGSNDFNSPGSDATGADDALQKTLPPSDSDMATMAIPIEEIRKGDDRFQVQGEEAQFSSGPSGDNPSITLAEENDDQHLIGSDESTAAAQQAVSEDDDDFGAVSYTAETIGLDTEHPERNQPISDSETRDYPYLPASNQAPVNRDQNNPTGNAFAAGAVTESQQVDRGSRDHQPSLSETGGSFAEFYGSRKSENPVIALLASWIRVIPKGFRPPVFVALGMVFGLLVVLMGVATNNVFSGSVGHLELQKMEDSVPPVNLKIFLDDRPVGARLPLRMTDVTPGKHVVRVEAAPPCETAEFEVTVPEGQSAFVPVPLFCGDKKGAETDKSKPFENWELKVRAVDHEGKAVEKAKIFLGGVAKGETPFSALIPRATASVEIKIAAKGYKEQRLTAAHNGVEKPPAVVVDLGKKAASAAPAVKPVKKPSATKPRKMTTLELLVRPDAAVYLDGKSTGRSTPLSGKRALEISVGTHVIEFRVKRSQKKYKYRVKVLEVDPANKIVIPKLGNGTIKKYGKVEVTAL